MAQTNVTIAARLLGGKWEAVLLKDGRFLRAMVSGQADESLGELVGLHLDELLRVKRNEGAEVGVSITVNEPDAD